MALLRLLVHKASEIMYQNNISTKFISTSCWVNAGFQGRSGLGLSSEIRQNQIERKKRLIAKLENMPLELKPVKDHKIRYTWKTEQRRRPVEPLSAEELERRVLLQKKWNTFVSNRKREEEKRLLVLKESQEKALYELRQESEELYQAAILTDDKLFPFTMEGPSETPPNKEYLAPLGTTVQREEDYD